MNPQPSGYEPDELPDCSTAALKISRFPSISTPPGWQLITALGTRSDLILPSASYRNIGSVRATIIIIVFHGVGNTDVKKPSQGRALFSGYEL